MKFLYRILLPIGLILAALMCYRVGAVQGSIAFFAIGILFEIGFWSKVFPSRSSSKNKKGAS